LKIDLQKILAAFLDLAEKHGMIQANEGNDSPKQQPKRKGKER